MKLTRLAAAVAIGLASIGAHAAINPTSPGSELVFAAYGDTNKQTFAFDTGIAITSFGVGSAAATSNLSFDLNSQGASFSNWLAANPDAVWAVFAFDTQGSAATPGTRAALTTSPTTVANGFSTQAAPWTAFATGGPQFINATNQLQATESTHGTQTNGASTHTKEGALDYASFDAGINSNLYGALTNGTLATTAISQSMTFVNIVNATVNGVLGTPVLTQYLQSDGTDAFWRVAANGGNASLTWTAVAPIPEPSDLAFMLAGLSLAGAIARRRKKNA